MPRPIVDGDLAFFTTWCPAAISIEMLEPVEGHRWAIEDSFEAAKNESGLDHNKSRTWHGCHREVPWWCSRLRHEGGISVSHQSVARVAFHPMAAAANSQAKFRSDGFADARNEIARMPHAPGSRHRRDARDMGGVTARHPIAAGTSNGLASHQARAKR
jgi:hypothetical protein